jgi:hypothetical protein
MAVSPRDAGSSAAYSSTDVALNLYARPAVACVAARGRAAEPVGTAFKPVFLVVPRALDFTRLGFTFPLGEGIRVLNVQRGFDGKVCRLLFNLD